MGTFYVTDYFITRHIFLNEEWLADVIEYIESKHRISGESLAKAVFDQWLHSPLACSTHPSFQWLSGNVLNQNLVFQIESILDIGSSYWSQYRVVTHVADNFDFFDAVNVDEIPKEKNYENNSSRMLLLELSDGVTKVKAIEYQKLPFLTPKTIAGSKMLLFGEVKHKKQILWLTPANCQLLGGGCRELAFQNRQEAILGRKLKIAKFYDEKVSETPTELITTSSLQDNRRSDLSPMPVATVTPIRQPEVITLSPGRPINSRIPRKPNTSMPIKTVTLSDSQEVVAPRLPLPKPVKVVPNVVEIVSNFTPVESLTLPTKSSFEVTRQYPAPSTSTADDVVADSDTEAEVLIEATNNMDALSRDNTNHDLISSNDNSSLFNLSISPIKNTTPKWVNPFLKKNESNIATSTPKESFKITPLPVKEESIRLSSKRLSFDNVDQKPIQTGSPTSSNDSVDNVLHDSDIEKASPWASKTDTVTSSQERREQEALINSICEDSDPEDIFSEISLQNLSVSPVKESSKSLPFVSRKRSSGSAGSASKPPVVKRINKFFLPSTSKSQKFVTNSSLLTHVKSEVLSDDDIVVLKPYPSTSKTIKTEPQQTETSLSIKQIKTELCDPDEPSFEAIDQFKKQKLLTIAKALQRLKYSIGCMRVQIHAVMKRVLIPFHAEDNQWVMKILVYDETSTGLDCYVSHVVLVKLLGMTPEEAVAIKASRNKERQRDGAKRIESIKTQLAREDIVFEIEFYSATNTIPLIVNVKTFSQLLLI